MEAIHRSMVLFAIAAVAEIGGAWLVWQGIRERRGLALTGTGIVALGLYGVVATFQPRPHFGRVLAAYGGVFAVGSLVWGIVFDGFRPDRYDASPPASASSACPSSCTRPAPGAEGRSSRASDGRYEPVRW